jgi:hypothetical protein
MPCIGSPPRTRWQALADSAARAIALAALAALLAWPAAPSHAAGEATAVLVTGNVQRLDPQTGWQAIRPGERLSGDMRVRTAPDALLGLIDAEGRAVRITGGRELSASPPEGDPSVLGSRGIAALHELFAAARRQSETSRKSPPGDASGSAPERLARHYESEWDELIHLPRIASFDLARALEAASYYVDRPYRNRGLALLLKVAADFPDHPGLARLARDALAAHGQPATFAVSHHVGGSSRDARSGEILRSGDELQIRFRSDTESFLYLYLRSMPEQGDPFTSRLFPAPGYEATALPPGADVTLPAVNDVYVLDDTVGREYFWAWVCAAPLDDPELEQAAVGAVTGKLAGADAFSDEIARDAAPMGCLQTFAFAFDHR